MTEKLLRIYLDDHLAFMVAELELIHRCWGSNQNTLLGDFLCMLENEVKAQQSIINDVVHRMGGKQSLPGRFKQNAAWVVEKLGRFKLNGKWLTYSSLSRVLELETLMAVAQERVALWDNLNGVAETDFRFEGITFSFFREQSQRHLDELNTRRRFAAAIAFSQHSNET
jgi:hypothetical protein